MEQATGARLIGLQSVHQYDLNHKYDLNGVNKYDVWSKMCS
jgi:hypothetical protein